LPEIPHVACFDTAFHATLPEVAWRYPVPYEWAEEWGVRRFGFHGLSVEWALREAAERLGRPVNGLSLVVAHLGSGCSVTAVKDGRSEWTSMGFTPLEGLMMGTRSGSIDPGLLLHLSGAERLGHAAVQAALEHQSGMLGVSGLAGDMRELRAAASAGHARAGMAIEMFVARAAEGIAAAMTWVDPAAIIFTGGIGENDQATRAEIVARLPGTARDIQVLVIRAREDLVMAAAATASLANDQSGDPRRFAT
jgi:acetate kinase